MCEEETVKVLCGLSARLELPIAEDYDSDALRPVYSMMDDPEGMRRYAQALSTLADAWYSEMPINRSDTSPILPVGRFLKNVSAMEYPIDTVEELNSVPAKVKPEEIKLAKQVIGTFEGKLNLADYKDEYREGLQDIIDRKVAGEEIVAPPVEVPPKVVNLMEALRKSLDSVSRAQKKPAKASVTRTVTKKRRQA